MRIVLLAMVLTLLLVGSGSFPVVTGDAQGTSYRPGAPGDADCSGTVEIGDALNLLRRVANISIGPTCGSDASGDGGVGPHDALLVVRFVTGLPVPPRAVTLSPLFVPQGSSATEFTVEGGLLQPGAELRWNSLSYPLTLLDGGSRAKVTVPASQFVSSSIAKIALRQGDRQSPETHFVAVTPPVCTTNFPNSMSLSVLKAPSAGQAEVVTIRMTGEVNMTGWQLRSLGDDGQPDQVFTFPPGYFYREGQESVEVHSGVPAFENSQNRLWWRGTPVWANDSRDDADLRDCDGNLVVLWQDIE